MSDVSPHPWSFLFHPKLISRVSLWPGSILSFSARGTLRLWESWLACGRAELLGSSDPGNRSFFFFFFFAKYTPPSLSLQVGRSWVMVHVILPSAQGTEAQVPTAVTRSLHTLQWPSSLLLSLPIPSVLPGTTFQINQLHLSPPSEPSWKGIQTKATQITALNVFFVATLAQLPFFGGSPRLTGYPPGYLAWYSG